MVASTASSALYLLGLCLLSHEVDGLMVDTAVKTGGLNSSSQWPFIVPLTRESVPVRRNNVTVSHKTSYSGSISLGMPAQEFRVVFDTGSAHVVVPSSDCVNETCIEHRRYNASLSKSSLAINVDGSAVPEDELCDQVTIGYGTGTITGEFARERVCPGSTLQDPDAPCFDVNVVMAVDMTAQPFRSFNFDGIFGLALDSLALSPEFSFFNSISASKSGAKPQFGVFLTDGEGGQQSEIAFGGHTAERTLTPLQWAPVAMADLGYWQVKVKEVRIGGKVLDICKDGSCRGIVDTGTSHLGVPGAALNDFMNRMSTDADHPTSDCREAEGSDLEIILESEITLNLKPEHYMRPIPLAMGGSVNSSNGSSAVGKAAAGASATAGPGSQVSTAVTAAETKDSRVCTPRLMPVNLPHPLGPNMFILGEPVLHRYYTVYDWGEKRVGFGMSASESNKKALSEGRLPIDQSTISFMQVTLKLTVRVRRKASQLPALSAPLEI